MCSLNCRGARADIDHQHCYSCHTSTRDMLVYAGPTAAFLATIITATCSAKLLKFPSCTAV